MTNRECFKVVKALRPTYPLWYRHDQHLLECPNPFVSLMKAKRLQKMAQRDSQKCVFCVTYVALDISWTVTEVVFRLLDSSSSRPPHLRQWSGINRRIVFMLMKNRSRRTKCISIFMSNSVHNWMVTRQMISFSRFFFSLHCRQRPVLTYILPSKYQSKPASCAWFIVNGRVSSLVSLSAVRLPGISWYLGTKTTAVLPLIVRWPPAENFILPIHLCSEFQQ